MMRRAAFSVGLSIMFIAALRPAEAGGSFDPANLKPGEQLPLLAGQTLTGKQLSLPSAAGPGVAVVLCSFSRTGGADARRWAERLSKDDPHLPVYNAIFLESVPRLFRSMAVSGIRAGMPGPMQDRTLLLYRDQRVWEQRLHVTDESHAGVVVLGEGGRVEWMVSGPFAESAYDVLRKQIQTAP